MGRSKGIAACQNNSGPSPAVFGFRISGSAGLRSARLCGSLALDALATADAHDPAVLKRGLSWRLQATRDGTHFPPLSHWPVLLQALVFRGALPHHFLRLCLRAPSWQVGLSITRVCEALPISPNFPHG